MKHVPSSLRLLLLVAGLATLPAFAGAVDLDALVKHSPFGEPKSTTVTEKPSNLEFRGMYVDHGITYFSIYNTTTKLSSWVAQGEAPAGLVPVSVKSYDADTDSIVLENAGQPVKLSLKQAVIGVAPAAAAPMPQVAGVATSFQAPPTEGGFSRGGFNGGQPPSAEQIAAFREQMNKGLESRGIKISLNDFIIKACALALQTVPNANAVWAGDRILKLKPSDVAVAVAVDGGLFTPVLRDADSKTLSALSAEMKDLAARAKTKKLAPHEYQGGSFAISNLGMMGVENFDAVINPPHGAILAVGAGIKKPVVLKDNSIGVATVMSMTLSVDHRVIDGALGAEFLKVVVELLENPVAMLA